MAALLQAWRRLCFRIGTRTGLFKPTAAQRDAEIRAALEVFKIKDVDDMAVKIFWRLRAEGVKNVSRHDVTEVLKMVSELQKEYGIKQ
uniref:Uncharacterized protein n=1 Tax=Triticum urartu TaxID=4572 RepID=A0A8R7TAX7_TRIUA